MRKWASCADTGPCAEKGPSARGETADLLRRGGAGRRRNLWPLLRLGGFCKREGTFGPGSLQHLPLTSDGPLRAAPPPPQPAAALTLSADPRQAVAPAQQRTYCLAGKGPRCCKVFSDGRLACLPSGHPMGPHSSAGTAQAGGPREAGTAGAWAPAGQRVAARPCLRSAFAVILFQSTETERIMPRSTAQPRIDQTSAQHDSSAPVQQTLDFSERLPFSQIII